MPVEVLKTSAQPTTTSTRGFDKCLQEIQNNINSKQTSKNTSEVTKSNITITTAATTAVPSMVNKGLATPLKRAILARRKSLSADQAPKAITATTTPAKQTQAGAPSTPAPLFNNYSNNGINQHFRSINTPLRQAILKRRKSINERASTPVEPTGIPEAPSLTYAPKPSSAKKSDGVDVPMTVKMRVEAMKSNLIVALQKRQQLTVPVGASSKPTITVPVGPAPTTVVAPDMSDSVMITADDAVTAADVEEVEMSVEQEQIVTAVVSEEPVPKQQRLCTLVASKLNLLMSKRRAVFKNFGRKIHFHTYRAGGSAAVKALRKAKAVPVATASDTADVMLECVEEEEEEEEASALPLSVEEQEECEAQQEAVIAATFAQLAVDAFASELELDQVCISHYSIRMHVIEYFIYIFILIWPYSPICI